MEIGQFDPTIIVVGERKRLLDSDKVAALEASIAAIGLRTPITIRIVPEMVIDGVEVAEVPLLVAGLHRLQACRNLGLAEIDAYIDYGSEIDARMWEIAENLHRAELTELEHAEHVEEWRKLSLEKKVAQVGPPGGIQKREAGMRETAKELGISRQNVERSKKIASLPPETKREAQILRLDNNQRALLGAAKQNTTEEQVRALREHAAKLAAEKTPDSASEARIAAAVAATKRLSHEELYVFAEWFEDYRAAYDIVPAKPGVAQR